MDGGNSTDAFWGTFYGCAASTLEWAALAAKETFFGIGGDEMARRLFALAVVAVVLVQAAARGSKADDAAAGESKLPIKRVVIFSPAGLERFFLEIGAAAPGAPADLSALVSAAAAHGFVFMQ